MICIIVLIIFIIFSLYLFRCIYYHKENLEYVKVYPTGHFDTTDKWIKSWEKMLDPSLPVSFTNKKDDATIILVINTPKDCDKEFVKNNKHKTIICQMEPWLIEIDDPENYLDIWFHDRALNNVEWYFPATFDCVKKDIPIQEKTKDNTISVVLSSNYSLDGHKKRIDFIKYLENHHENIKLDIYSATNDFNFKNYKGPIDDKSSAMIPYKYHFNCENTFTNNYITEKFTDGILCENYLFYGGAPNINNVYPGSSYTLLDMNDFEKSAQMIIDCINDNVFDRELDNIRKLKQYILNTYTLSPRILKVVEQKLF